MALGEEEGWRERQEEKMTRGKQEGWGLFGRRRWRTGKTRNKTKEEDKEVIKAI